MRCDECERDAVVDQPYAGAHRCGPHLADDVRERVRRELHRQVPRFRGGTVAVALSGGKDSAVALSLVHAYFRRRPNVRVVAISVDEGIARYRTKTLEAARALTAALGVEHVVTRADEALGVTTDGAVRQLPGTVPCSFCGVWRRRLLNDAARAAGAELLVLGFNLDDLAQTVLMNLARADLDRLARMAPHPTRQPGLIPRIAPLASIPEREVYLFARLEGIPFDHGECPHAGAAARNVYREVLWRLEESFPGTRHALMRTREALVTRLVAEDRVGAPGRCASCGEPATGFECRACAYRRLAQNTLMGAARS